MFRRFVLAMSYVGLAILDFERHRIANLISWHIAKLELRTLKEAAERWDAAIGESLVNRVG